MQKETTAPFRSPEGNAKKQHFRLGDMLALFFVLGGGITLLCALAFADTAFPITVEADGYARQLLVKEGTVSDALLRAGIRLRAGDIVNAPLEEELQAQAHIRVTRAFPVAVASGGEVTLLRMLEGHVGEALKKAGISYDADDELTHLPFEDVAPGMHIQHIDVRVEYETSDEVVERRQEIIKDKERYIGQDKIQKEGEDGERRIVRRLVYKDGELASREIMNQIILKEAVTEVKIVGTKIRYQTNFEGDTRLWEPRPTGDQIKQRMTVQEITAYTHTGRRTATGKRTRIGYVAVNPNVIPYGTRMWIPGYGYCVAQDTGAFRHEQGGMKNQIDIFLNTEQECRQWGRKRNVRIYILN